MLVAKFANKIVTSWFINEKIMEFIKDYEPLRYLKDRQEVVKLT